MKNHYNLDGFIATAFYLASLLCIGYVFAETIIRAME